MRIYSFDRSSSSSSSSRHDDLKLLKISKEFLFIYFEYTSHIYATNDCVDKQQLKANIWFSIFPFSFSQMFCMKFSQIYRISYKNNMPAAYRIRSGEEKKNQRNNKMSFPHFICLKIYLFSVLFSLSALGLRKMNLCVIFSL